MREYLLDILYFGLKEARAALFAGTFLVLLVVTSLYPDAFGLYRYDTLFIASVLIQVVLVATRLETPNEAKAILLFHIIGLVLELYKTHPSVGSWAYTEPSIFKIGTAPLYSGFMYAAIGSYMVQAWKLLHLRLVNHPPYWASIMLCAAIYVNFFTNHFFQDMRVLLYAVIVLLYARTTIYFTPRIREYRMPLICGFALTGFFVWVAENVGTYVGAWTYPNQTHVWNVVSLHKITSWGLMVIICFIIVAYLMHRIAIIRGVLYKK